jgi:hypothetical protein
MNTRVYKGEVMSGEGKTEADKVAEVNNWTWAYAAGYLDGHRDTIKGQVITNGRFGLSPQGRQDDYSLGYYKGVSA